MFPPVSAGANFPLQEEEILRFWRESGIYEKSLAQRSGAERFVFYEGPPTANGMPHPGHCLTRAIKDLFPRYKTMRGYLCERKAGWDTHGLPVEVEVCKALGIHSKEEIENYGIEPFIHKCQESVWRYMQEWERLTERIGFWVNLKEAYVTYHQSYVESVWWSLKNLFDRGLLYQGHKIVWWWAQGGTALSSGEVGQGYREVADPSVYVLFPLVDDTQARSASEGSSSQSAPTSLLVWTTTPWTLPSNQFAAVHPDLDYATVVDSETGQRIIMAAALVETIAGKVKRELTVESTCKGRDLLGRRYIPPFNYYYGAGKDATGKLKPFRWTQEAEEQYIESDLLGAWQATGLNHSALDEALYHQNDVRSKRDFEFKAWRVLPAGFVTTDSGTGIVHQAPAFGEVDYLVLVAEQARFLDGQGPQIINAVAPDGKFTAEAPDYQGRWVKDCDKDITRRLKEEGKLYHQEQYLHDYPFCWRAEEDPLIQYPRRSWFIRTTQLKDHMLANNEQINWLPEHIKHGRFGNFLETNVDWALSRERYWGTPLPIWVCEQTGKMEAVSSYDELLKKDGVTGTEVWDAAKKARPSLPDDLRVHKPYIDAITYDSPFGAGARMNRVSEVIDCWYDSGAMPFAQWGYRGEDGPHVAKARFHEQFPAHFISEALDQTRGWFYSQLAISTMLFGTLGFRETPSGRVQNAVFPTPYPHPFKNCIVLGLMQSEWYEVEGAKGHDAYGVGSEKRRYLSEEEAKAVGPYTRRVGKMSKSLRNYREPSEIFNKYGADALRWYFFGNQQPWNSILYSERAIKDTIPEFILRLWNCFSFFVNYAIIDGFDPAAALNQSAKAAGRRLQLIAADFADAKDFRPVSYRSELDRWVLNELDRTCKGVIERMDAYDNYEACKLISQFVDGLSNWYVRRSRDRFWMADKQSSDKIDAYWTLYECLLTVSKLIAPFTPFLAEAIWRNLSSVFAGAAVESVHLCDYPTGITHIGKLQGVSIGSSTGHAIPNVISEQMALLRQIASLGLSARMANKLKVRQPLSKVEVILSDLAHQPWLEEHDELLRDELNVKTIEYTKDAEKYITYQVQPNFKRLGPRIAKLLPACKASLGQADGGRLLAELTAPGKVTLDLSGEKIELDNEDIQVRLQAKPGWAAAQGAGCVVVLSTELTPELLAEGLARDLVRLIQDRRKDLNLVLSDNIEIGIVGASAALQQAIEQNREYICSETLATKLVFEALPSVEGIEVEIGDEKITLYVRRVAD